MLPRRFIYSIKKVLMPVVCEEVIHLEYWIKFKYKSPSIGLFEIQLVLRPHFVINHGYQKISTKRSEFFFGYEHGELCPWIHKDRGLKQKKKISLL